MHYFLPKLVNLVPPDVRFSGLNAPNPVLLGLCLRPRCGAYSTPPDSLAVFKGPISRGREGRGGRGRGEDRMEK